MRSASAAVSQGRRQKLQTALAFAPAKAGAGDSLGYGFPLPRFRGGQTSRESHGAENVDEKPIHRYVTQQIRQMLEAISRRPETLRAWFGKSGPRDREILILLALSTMGPGFPMRHRFASLLEAVARLPLGGPRKREFIRCEWAPAFAGTTKNLTHGRFVRPLL